MKSRSTLKKEDIASDYLSLNLILKGNVTCQSENQNKRCKLYVAPTV